MRSYVKLKKGVMLIKISRKNKSKTSVSTHSRYALGHINCNWALCHLYKSGWNLLKKKVSATIFKRYKPWLKLFGYVNNNITNWSKAVESTNIHLWLFPLISPTLISIDNCFKIKLHNYQSYMMWHATCFWWKSMLLYPKPILKQTHDLFGH